MSNEFVLTVCCPEAFVLPRAVTRHAEPCVLLNGNRTAVFR